MTTTPSPLSFSPAQRSRILSVTGGICERCKEPRDFHHLRIHPLPGETNPEKSILILCPRCEQEIRILRTETCRVWVEQRPFHTRGRLRKILGYCPPAYIPPEAPDLADLYQSACTGWCLNGSG